MTWRLLVFGLTGYLWATWLVLALLVSFASRRAGDWMLDRYDAFDRWADG